MIFDKVIGCRLDDAVKRQRKLQKLGDIEINYDCVLKSSVPKDQTRYESSQHVEAWQLLRRLVAAYKRP